VQAQVLSQIELLRTQGPVAHASSSSWPSIWAPSAVPDGM
jgi:hypothetical protein